ncbi:MAG: deoxyguanosinetriphosphate triphosphohydrolase [Bacillota bacterium]|nr:deoxyguanosinetriphosphate triphosphohydrolase [Bacillota bacterium]
MNIRQQLEELEAQILDPKASFSKKSLGREVFEEESEVRTAFQRDRDRILHSKAFRRLKHKTQVFIAPEQDHYRTRLTHTLEVAQICRTLARALRLNEDLAEAISLGHDLGHTPFGHSGEEVLNKLHPQGFKHYEQSVRIVRFLEQRRSGQGLNLTAEVIDGIRNHSGSNQAFSLEGKLLKFADRIAYLNHDIDDALRANVISLENIPKEYMEVLGSSHSKRIDTMIKDLIFTSLDKGEISMSPHVLEAMNGLRKFMFQNVYLNPVVKSEEDKISHILTELYHYYYEDLERIPKHHLSIYDNIKAEKEDIVCDYISGMTDTFVIKTWKEIYEPKMWK